MRIGIVGAENTHSAAIGRTLNIDRALGEARVVALWGETRALAEEVAHATEIPDIVDRPEEMIGRIDGVVIAHRDGRRHADAARPFLDARIPVFVDKPFTCGIAEGLRLLRRAKRLETPITSFSVMTMQQAFTEKLLAQVRAAGRITLVESRGPCDIRSPYGGVFFYGIHQVEMILRAFGHGIETAQIVRASEGNPDAIVTMTYPRGGPLVSMALVAGTRPPFAVRAAGEKGMVDVEIALDENPYLAGTRRFLEMFRTRKEPLSPQELLEPIAVLQAIERSLERGKRTHVSQVRFTP